eukprot:m.309501 g.309501  ORF g.309501 m.309501 type:complete len:477 (+) comp46704_c0_seq1:58-1488(+)
MAASWRSELKASLREVLKIHDGDCDFEDPSQGEWSQESYVTYETRQRDLLATYGEAADRQQLTALCKEVEDEMFAEVQQKVDKHLAKVREPACSFEEVAQSYSALMWAMSPWASCRSYFAADRFLQQGGVATVMKFIASSGPDGLEIGFGTLIGLASSASRTRSLLTAGEGGVLKPLYRLMSGSQEDRTLFVGLLASVIQDPLAQVFAVENGILTHFRENFQTASLVKFTELSYLANAAACLHWCCTNPSLTSQIVESDVIDPVLDCCRKVTDAYQERFAPEQEEDVLFQYYGYSAAAALCHQVEERRRIDRLLKKETPPHILKFDDTKFDSTSIDVWMEKNPPDTVFELSRMTGQQFFSLECFLIRLLAAQPAVRRMAAFSLQSAFQGPSNRMVCWDETGGRFDVVQCSTWGRDATVRRYARGVMEKVYPAGVNSPSLKNLCLFCVSDNYAKYGEKFVVEAVPKIVAQKIIPFRH